MFLLRMSLGFLLILLGLGYLFQPKLIIRINAFMRDRVFSDSNLVFNPKRTGLLLVLIGFFLWLLALPVPPR